MNGADTRRAVRKAAIERIWRHRFAAMNLRDLAADVDLRLGSLYNHVPHRRSRGTRTAGALAAGPPHGRNP